MLRLKRRGIFITLEGIDGTGKSTQLRLLARWLRRRGYKPYVTREPGGTRAGEQIRDILVSSHNNELTALAELLLMYAARQQHLEEFVRPVLARGGFVLSDRFNDASFAYQGYGRKLRDGPVYLLDQLICGRTQPDLTLVLDAPARVALARAHQRDGRSPRRRFESQGLRFYERVRKGYLQISNREPGRVKLIPADRAVREVQSEVRGVVGAFLRRREQGRGKPRAAQLTRGRKT
ncbi:MAG: dTMP kinase [Terriglobia bacterium]